MQVTQTSQRSIFSALIRCWHGRRALIALAVVWASLPAVAANVYIVDTAKREHSLALAEAVNRACSLCRPVKYMDMRGSFRIGREIAYELRDREAEGALDLVITLGRPATRLVMPELGSTPLFHSLTGAGRSTPDSPSVIGFNTDPPIELQMAALKSLSPNVTSVGFIATKGTLDAVRQDILEAASVQRLDIKFYYVENAYDVPEALRRAIQQTSGLIFLRDKTVINGDTARYILRMTLENQIPTISFSDALVRKGMLAALIHDTDKLGERIGEAAQFLLSNGRLPDETPPARYYQLLINGASLEQIPGARASAPDGVSVVLQ